jgi:hypothetical protein
MLEHLYKDLNCQKERHFGGQKVTYSLTWRKSHFNGDLINVVICGTNIFSVSTKSSVDYFPAYKHQMKYQREFYT